MKILKTVGLVALVAGAIVWNTQVLVWLWRWFVARPFDLPQLGFLSMLGLQLFANLFRLKPIDMNTPTGPSAQERMVSCVIIATLTLVIGLVIRGLIYWMGG